MNTVPRLFVVLLFAALLAACGGAPAPVVNAPTSAPEATSAPAVTLAPTNAPQATSNSSTTAPATTSASTAGTTATFPLTIQNCGNTLTFQKPPERVVTMNGSATEVMLALGLGERVVGKAYPDDVILPELAQADAKIPLLAKEYPSREVVTAANPDFIFAGLRSAFENEAAGAREDWQTRGVNTYLATEYCVAAGASNQQAATLDTLYTDIRAIGTIFSITERAETYIKRLQDEVAATTSRLSATTPVKVVIFDSAEPDPYVVGGTAMAHTLATLAGGQNVFGDLPERYPKVSWETILQRNADVVVVLDYSGQTAEQKIAVLKSTLGERVPAVKNNRFVVVKLADVLTSIRNPRAVRQMAQAFYPDQFK